MLGLKVRLFTVNSPLWAVNLVPDAVCAAYVRLLCQLLGHLLIAGTFGYRHTQHQSGSVSTPPLLLLYTCSTPTSTLLLFDFFSSLSPSIFFYHNYLSSKAVTDSKCFDFNFFIHISKRCFQISPIKPFSTIYFCNCLYTYLCVYIYAYTCTRIIYTKYIYL